METKFHLNLPGVHPRLQFTDQEVHRLRDRLAREPALAEAFDSWRREAELLLDQEFMTEETANSVYSQHGRFYEIGAQLMEMGEKLGLLYRMTGDPRYAGKLREAMLYYAGFRCWTGPANAHRDTPWTSDLTTTRILWGYAMAWDCIRDTLSPAQQDTIRRAMVENGIRPLLNDWVLPGTRVHALDSMGHNWWAVCIALAGAGLCAIYEDVPEADSWMEAILAALTGFCTYPGSLLLNKVPNFDDQGLFYESVNYFNYGAGELMRFAWIFSRLFENGKALTRFPHMDQVPAAFSAMSYPTSDPENPLLFPNFGDSALRGTYTLLPQAMLLYGFDSEEMRFLYARCRKKPEALDFLYPQILDAGPGSLEAIPKSMVFGGSGYAYLRTSWEPDATLLAIRCGYTWNHAHEDAGHFLLLADGAPVIPDAGTCSYDRPEYKNYYKTCQAHNVITIDGRAQQAEALDRGAKFPGTLSHFVDGPMKYLLADVTGPTCDSCSRNYRSFLWLCPDILVVIDDLKSHKKAEFASLFHCSGRPELTENGIRAEGKTPLSAWVLYPEKVRAERRTGYLPPSVVKGLDPNSPEVLPEQDYFAFLAPEKTEVIQFLSCYAIHGAADAAPRRISGPNWIGLEISYGGTTWQAAYNLLADGRKMHENSNNRLLGLETDAYILAIQTDPDGSRRVLMAYGSYLREGRRSLFESFTKEFKTFSL